MDELEVVLRALIVAAQQEALENQENTKMIPNALSAINSLTLKQVLSLINGAEEQHSEKWYQNSNPQEVGEAMGRDEVLEELRQSAERIWS